MGVPLWLPLGKLYPRPSNEREELLNRLYNVRTLVPDARELEIQQLRDLVQMAEEKHKARQSKEAIALLNQKLPTESEVAQIKEGLKQFLKWRKRVKGY